MSFFIANNLGVESRFLSNYWVASREGAREKIGNWSYAHAAADSSIFVFDGKVSARRLGLEQRVGHALNLADLFERGSSVYRARSRSLQSAPLPRSTPETLEDFRKMDVQAVKRRLLGFLKNANLDDEDAAERLQKAVRDALVFMFILSKRLPLPNASSYSDYGEVVLRWSLSDKKAEVAFLGNDEVEYTYHANGRYVPGRELAQPTQCPGDLEEYLTV